MNVSLNALHYNPSPNDKKNLFYVLAFGIPPDPLVYIIIAVSESLLMSWLSFNGFLVKVVHSFPHCSNFAKEIVSPKTSASHLLPIFY